VTLQSGFKLKVKTNRFL